MFTHTYSLSLNTHKYLEMPKCKKERSIASLYIHNFSIRNKSDYIAHQTLLIFKPQSSYIGFCFPSARRFSWRWEPCHKPGSEFPLQSGAVIWGEAACRAWRAYMSTLGWPGKCSMHLAGFGGYCLQRCPLEIHMHLN